MAKVYSQVIVSLCPLMGSSFFAFLVLFYFLHDADGKERHKEHCQEDKGKNYN